MKISGIVFDMDGVLLDTERISEQAWHAAAEKTASPEAGAMYAVCTGMTMPKIRAALEERTGKECASAFLAAWNGEFDRIAARGGIPAMPFAQETLAALQGRYRLALASSTFSGRVRPQLEAAGLLRFFEVLVTGDMVQNGKPDPEIYLRACSALDLPPESCVAVEDSPNGIASAFAAGLKPVMIPDRIKPDAETLSRLWRRCASLREFARIAQKDFAAENSCAGDLDVFSVR